MAGFLLSSVFLGIFVHPNASVHITEKSPSWIGAWWLGIAIGTAFALIIGILLTGLPKKFRKRDGNKINEESVHKVHKYIALIKSLDFVRRKPVVAPAANGWGD